MCNEFRIRWIDGHWVWVATRRKHAPKEAAQGSFAFAAEQAREWVFNVTGDRVAPIVRRGEDGELEVVEMRFGFPPLEEGGKLIRNIRNLKSPYWRDWLEPRWRCLVPVTEFAEPDGDPPRGQKWFKLKNDEPFMFAGVWRQWEGARGTPARPIAGKHLLFAFVTTDPNSVIAPVHKDSMPLILPRDQWERWLDASFEEIIEMQKGGFPASRTQEL